MPHISDAHYFERRYKEFSEKSDQAADPELSRIYADFAENYKKAAQYASPAQATDEGASTLS
ncbi:hypothetical protein [Pseudonocardia sp. TMWB2A]|uniref:hypothetical protein n=1 Tax=Pseudonocardia sp. TMWB2A TaxID=687430 RepID=UPI00307ED76F